MAIKGRHHKPPEINDTAPAPTGEIATRRDLFMARAQAGSFSLGRFEIPVLAGALIWLAYELIILIGPDVFRDAQYYVLGALGVGVVFYIGQWLLEPGAMRAEEGAHGAEALADTAAPAAGGTPAGP